MFIKRFSRIIFCLVFFLCLVKPVYAWEIDETSIVTRVVDGDSFFIIDDEVRLADVSAPEWDEPGGSLATSKMIELIDGKQVFLDTDQKTGRGPYGRLIAVVYIEYNSTHYLNVNQALLDQGVVKVTDYSNNEFSPYSWTLYTRYSYDAPSIENQITSIVSNVFTSIISVGLILVLFKVGRPRGNESTTFWRTGFTKNTLILVFLLGLRILVYLTQMIHFVIIIYVCLYVISLIGILTKKKWGTVIASILTLFEIYLLLRKDFFSITLLWNLFILYLIINELLTQINSKIK